MWKRCDGQREAVSVYRRYDRRCTKEWTAFLRTVKPFHAVYGLKRRP